MEDFFEKFMQKFQKNITQPEGDAGQIDPERINRAQNTAEQRKKQHGAAQGAKQEEQAKLALLRHNEQKQRRRRAGTHQRVQQQLPHAAARAAQRAGDLIEQGQRAAQKDGTKKLGKLEGYLISHRAYPNRRRRKPL